MAVDTEYQINIPVFEGPLDLLLHLVTKNRIDIHDIPIHLITDQYLAYLHAAQRFNLELGSSFFTMASTLLLIKSRMLLPKRRQEETDEAEDSRQELTRSLEEFKRMKEIKARIEELMEEQRPYRGKEPEMIRGGLYTGKISLLKLQAAFFSLYDALHEETEETLSSEEVSLDEAMDVLENTLKRLKSISFVSYFRKQRTRLRLAVTLMALLELIRLGQVTIRDSAEGLMLEGKVH